LSGRVLHPGISQEYVLVDGRFSQDVTEGQAAVGRDADGKVGTVAKIVAFQVMKPRKHQGGARFD